MSLMPLEEAVARILAVQPSPLPVTIPMSEAAGRYACAQVLAAIDLPPFDNSSMDGYAVHACDTLGASKSSPVHLHLTGRLPAGTETQPSSLARGACMRVFTGSPIPPGANAVVMQEDTLATPETVEVLEPVKPWENLRLQGEDFRQGASICEPGWRMTPALVALAQACGVATQSVAAKPLVGILATGDELLEPESPIAPGKIYESNRALLRFLVDKAGASPRCFPLVPDTLSDTQAALEDAVASCDVVITTGGASVGDHDWVKTALIQAGGTIDLWRIAIKPGKPFLFAQLKGKPVFGLPGNPISALVTFALLVRPALLHRQGALDLSLPTSLGTLAHPIHNPGPRRHFVRVKVEPNGLVSSSGTQSSHMLSSLASSSGLLEVPADDTIAEGTKVEVLHWDA